MKTRLVPVCRGSKAPTLTKGNEVTGRAERNRIQSVAEKQAAAKRTRQQQLKVTDSSKCGKASKILKESGKERLNPVTDHHPTPCVEELYRFEPENYSCLPSLSVLRCGIQQMHEIADSRSNKIDEFKKRNGRRKQTNKQSTAPKGKISSVFHCGENSEFRLISKPGHACDKTSTPLNLACPPCVSLQQKVTVVNDADCWQSSSFKPNVLSPLVFDMSPVPTVSQPESILLSFSPQQESALASSERCKNGRRSVRFSKTLDSSSSETSVRKHKCTCIPVPSTCKGCITLCKTGLCADNTSHSKHLRNTGLNSKGYLLCIDNNSVTGMSNVHCGCEQHCPCCNLENKISGFKVTEVNQAEQSAGKSLNIKSSSRRKKPTVSPVVYQREDQEVSKKICSCSGMKTLATDHRNVTNGNSYEPDSGVMMNFSDSDHLYSDVQEYEGMTKPSDVHVREKKSLKRLDMNALNNKKFVEVGIEESYKCNNKENVSSSGSWKTTNPATSLEPEKKKRKSHSIQPPWTEMLSELDDIAANYELIIE